MDQQPSSPQSVPPVSSPVSVEPAKPHLRTPFAIVFAIVSVLAALEGYAFHAGIWPHSAEPTPTPTSVVQATPTPNPAVEYRNTDFGFFIPLNESWKGYTVNRIKEDIYDVSGKTKVNNGVVGSLQLIELHHPLESATNPRAMMPIMVFTLEQWAHIQKQEWGVGAAPVPPSELGRNSKYVFALPARYNYAYKPGWEEVDQLVHGLKAFEFTDTVTGYKIDCMSNPESLRAKYSWYPHFEEQITAEWQLSDVCYNAEINRVAYLKLKYSFDGGKTGDSSQLGVYTITNDAFEKAPVHTVRPHMGCHIDSWSKDGIIRYECGGGDAGHGGSQTYEYSLSANTLILVEECFISPETNGVCMAP